MGGSGSTAARRGGQTLRATRCPGAGLVLSLSLGGPVWPDRAAGDEPLERHRPAGPGGIRQRVGGSPANGPPAGRSRAAAAAGVRHGLAGFLRSVLHAVVAARPPDDGASHPRDALAAQSGGLPGVCEPGDCDRRGLRRSPAGGLAAPAGECPSPAARTSPATGHFCLLRPV